jgi:hypothetical protein
MTMPHAVTNENHKIREKKQSRKDTSDATKNSV